MAYKAPHTGLERVITAARAMVDTHDHGEGPTRAELRAALKTLDTDEGMLATKDEVDAATEAHVGYSDDDTVNVDSFGSALVSHGDDGYWVSGWVFVPVPPEEEDEEDEEEEEES